MLQIRFRFGGFLANIVSEQGGVLIATQSKRRKVTIRRSLKQTETVVVISINLQQQLLQYQRKLCLH